MSYLIVKSIIEMITVSQGKYVEVALTNRGMNRLLTYRLGNAVDNILPGMLVKVPFVRGMEVGVVAREISVNEDLADGGIGIPLEKIRELHEVLYQHPVMTPDLIQLADWMKRYYGASSESVYESMLPAVVRKGFSAKTQHYIRLCGELSSEAYAKLQKKAPKQALLYDFLKGQTREVERGKALSRLGIASTSLEALVKLGLVEEISSEFFREAYGDDLASAERITTQAVTLNSDQQAAVDSIASSLDERKFRTHLLHGVTGSGKTEVYLKAIEQVVASGGAVIFLVSEVSLTPQTVGRIRGRLEAQGIRVVVWHSMLSDGERFDAWMAMARGEARVVVGARSAIFAPMPNVRLIVVDEEHEPAYKQGESPRYQGRDVAVYRASLCKAVCVLGSATPSLESLYNVQTKGYKLNLLKERVDNRQLPLIHVIDMKQELLKGKGPVLLSRLLVDKMVDRFEKREQSILFLNRRGYFSGMMCLDCGHVMMCPHCSVSLTYHRADEKLRCHMCAYEQGTVKQCPGCRTTNIKWKGSGTQRVEDVVHKILPKANVVRMDADTMSKKNLFREILGDFRKGKIDILIGTQMIAKGLDFPNVTLVGLIDADLSLHMQDFRASERTFQLVVQVSGRAGRGDKAGEVVIQSYTPFSAPIQYAKRGDFDSFLADELEMRREYLYPPFRHLIRYVFRGKNQEKVEYYIDQWAKLLETNFANEIEIKGPAPAPLEKLRNEFRYHVWVFTSNVSKIMPRLLELRSHFKLDKDVIDTIDVDPVDLG